MSYQVGLLHSYITREEYERLFLRGPLFVSVQIVTSPVVTFYVLVPLLLKALKNVNCWIDTLLVLRSE